MKNRIKVETKVDVKKCSVSDCMNIATERGMCHKHYQQLWKQARQAKFNRMFNIDKAASA